MGKNSTSTLLVLVAIFATNMTLQICCHQDWSTLVGHEHPAKKAAHSHSHDHSKNTDDASNKEECGSHKFKELVTADKLVASHNLPVRSYIPPFSKPLISGSAGRPGNSLFRLIFFNKIGPPIHLLNSVFLN
ncbi:hypothetical protein [Fodinibius salsisoli]|uniref:Uncharacterized protein n=1 Tax=Fodinibius salsisoli TaxID=2820877 RepID=A0ABT3PJX0_9BACT|nr:hypothetical protein [Fodinibius salsisoli]MCW9706237.1 hypothetical protein [Fodinibius salsisoli]